MSIAMIGAVIGALFGLVNFFLLQKIADNMAHDAKTAGSRSTAGLLKTLAWVDLVVFPVLGYFIAPLAFG